MAQTSGARGRWRFLAGRLFRMLLLVILGFALLVVLLLSACQRGLIYYPQPYGLAVERLVGLGAERIPYEIGMGRQFAFYVPPRERAGDPPDRLWVLTGGNASLALDWLDLVGRAPDPRAGFLLIDYPGYGFNDGRPTRDSIREGTLAAFEAAMLRLGLRREDLAGRLALMGHSLGAAAALELATAIEPPPRQLILVSPFTSLMAMARRTVGWPLAGLLLDRFDNQARLAELAGRSPRPSVTIIHGDSDEVIPVQMGRELAAEFDWIDYIEIPRGDHNWILQSAEHAILQRMEPQP